MLDGLGFVSFALNAIKEYLSTHIITLKELTIPKLGNLHKCRVHLAYVLFDSLAILVPGDCQQRFSEYSNFRF